MSYTVQMICRVCEKETAYPWKEFTRWLRKNAGRPLEDYMCHDCSVSFRNRTHGKSKTPLYIHWKSMFVRTRGQSLEANKKYYVEKGIKVCPEWANFKVFEKWALENGFNPKAGFELDRIDGSKGYAPDNCQWLTKTQHRQKSWEERNSATD